MVESINLSQITTFFFFSSGSIFVLICSFRPARYNKVSVYLSNFSFETNTNLLLRLKILDIFYFDKIKYF